jgi:hypothetical protein
VTHRVLAAVALFLGLLLGYAGGGSRIDAQAPPNAPFPFRAGDNIRVLFEIEDRGGEPCVIESFQGSFVTCKSSNNGSQLAFNARKVVKVTRIGPGQ